MKIFGIAALAYFTTFFNPNLGTYINQLNQKPLLLQVKSKISQGTLIKNSDKTNELNFNVTAMTAIISAIATSLGVIITGLGLLRQINKSRQEQQYLKIASIRSSFINLRGNLRVILQRAVGHSEEPIVNQTLQAICFFVVLQLKSYLSYANSKSKVLDALDNKVKEEYLFYAIEAGLRTNEIRTELVTNLDKIRTISSRYEPDMPLTTGIINDCLFIISWGFEALTSAQLFARIFPKSPNTFLASNDDRRNGFSNLRELTSDDSNITYEEITKILIQDGDNILNSQIKPVVYAASKIINLLLDLLLELKPRELNKLKISDDSPPHNIYDPVENITINWNNLKKLLSPILRDENKLEEIHKHMFIELRRILETSRYYNKDSIYHLVQNYPDLDVAI